MRDSPIKDDSIHISVRYKSRTVPFASGTIRFAAIPIPFGRWLTETWAGFHLFAAFLPTRDSGFLEKDMDTVLTFKKN